MKSRTITMALALLLLVVLSCKNEESYQVESGKSAMDLVQVRELLEQRNKHFAESFKRSDSVALAEHYSTDGTWGSIKGRENLISAWGKSIRYASDMGTPEVRFIINSVSSDGEFVIEAGSYEFLDNSDASQSSGKYLVVRKLEDGKWKIYRDIGL